MEKNGFVNWWLAQFHRPFMTTLHGPQKIFGLDFSVAKPEKTQITTQGPKNSYPGVLILFKRSGSIPGVHYPLIAPLIFISQERKSQFLLAITSPYHGQKDSMMGSPWSSIPCWIQTESIFLFLLLLLLFVVLVCVIYIYIYTYIYIYVYMYIFIYV